MLFGVLCPAHAECAEVDSCGEAPLFGKKDRLASER